jgi:hypothetical protein
MWLVALASTAASHAAEHPSHPSLSRAERIAADRESAREMDAKRAADFAAEPTDARWADASMAQVRSVLDALKRDGLLAADLSCRSRTCRVRVEAATTEALMAGLQLLALDVVGTLPVMHVSEVDESGDGHATVTVYLSR